MSREGEVVMGLRNPTRPTLQGGQRMREDWKGQGGSPRRQIQNGDNHGPQPARTTQAKTGHEQPRPKLATKEQKPPKRLGEIQKQDPGAVVVDRGAAKRSQGAMAEKAAERLKDAEGSKEPDHREEQDDLETPSKDEKAVHVRSGRRRARTRAHTAEPDQPR